MLRPWAASGIGAMMPYWITMLQPVKVSMASDAVAKLKNLAFGVAKEE